MVALERLGGGVAKRGFTVCTKHYFLIFLISHKTSGPWGEARHEVVYKLLTYVC